MTVNIDGLTEAELAEFYEDAKTLKDGVNSNFWKVLKKILLKNEQDAFKRWLDIDPKEHAAVSELQMLAKVSLGLIATVEESADFVDSQSATP